MFTWFAQVFDVTLLATIGLVFFASLLGAYIRASRRDPCLKSFAGYHVTLELADNRLVWGVMDLEATGLELRYRNSVQDDNHVESSYVLYAGEFGQIQSLYRYADDLDEESKQRRHRDLDRSFHPGLPRRIVRGLRNFVSLASESLSEVVGLIIGGLRKPAGRYITEAGETHLKSLGSTFVGQVGSGYDPLLEHYVGHKMVFELMEDDEVHEHVGIFKNYSPDFMEILDVQYPQPKEFTISEDGMLVSDQLRGLVEGDALRVVNDSQQPVLLQSLIVNERAEMLNVVVDAGEAVVLHPGVNCQSAKLSARVIRELDLIVPRTRCVVRHRAEFYKPEILPSIIFDLGVLLKRKPQLDANEARLRQQLAQNPLAAWALANLGAILVQKQQYDEADRLLQQAWKMRYSLPDNGRRTRLLLQELARKRSLNPTPAPAPDVLGTGHPLLPQ